VELGGYRIPSGTILLWSPYLAGRDPQVWPDPLRFDPDRFRDATEQQRTLARTGWVPFGGGSRHCIGFALAQMELTVLLARLARRLDLTTATTTMPRPAGMVVNRPAGGVVMRVHERR
jgi:cytochrome P450